MFTDIRRGFAAAVSHYRLVALVWVSYALLAVAATVPALSWWHGALSGSMEAATLLKRFNFAVLADALKYDGIGGFSMLTGGVVGAGLLALFASPFVMGGVLAVLGDKGRVHSFMARYFGGGGYFYWRFFRLMLIFGASVVVVGGATTMLAAAAAPLFGESEYGTYLGVFVDLVLVKFVCAAFFLALDYARIRVVQDDSRKMLRAYGAGLAFVLRHLLTTYAAALIVVSGAGLLLVGYLAYETLTPVASTWGLIAVLIAVQQAFHFLRTGLRIALIDTETRIWERLKPRPAVVEAAPAPSVSEIPHLLSSEGDDSPAPESS